MQQKISPMLATLIDEPFNSKDWLFEIKWDGYRALAFIEKKKVQLYSRTYHSFNSLFPDIVKELSKKNIEAIFDGEVVILDKKGRSQFQLMQNYQRTQEGALYYYVFDILYLNGRDLRDLPLIERKEILRKTLKGGTQVKYSDHVLEKGIPFFKAATKKKLEGIIGKNIQSTYVSRRTRDWVKIKTKMRQEAIIAGFTAPRGSREKFGALLLGVYNDEGKLEYIGHVGGGFNTKLLREVFDKMKPLIQEKSPFKVPPKPNTPVTWLKPKLVCEVAFSEWTNEGIMRQPIFQGLRIDKKSREVVREMP